MCHTRVALLRPRPSAGVSSLIAPVALVRLDQMARENFAGVECDDCDFTLIDDGQDATSGMGGTDLEVIEAAAAPQGQGTLLVGDVVTSNRSVVTYVLNSDTPGRAKTTTCCGEGSRTARSCVWDGLVGEAHGGKIMRRASDVLDPWASDTSESNDGSAGRIA
jgi:hypothetical protein